MDEGENRDKACESKPVHRSPKLSIKVAKSRFGLRVAVLCVVIGVFTVFAVEGIELPETVYDAVGSSTNADNRSEVYNFRSGLCMAFFEVFIAWWIEKFQPTFIVFLHNWLWPPNDSSTPSKFTYHCRSAVIIVAPVAVVLTLGNSIRGFQATPTTVGYNSTMILDDFKKSQSNLERLQAEAVSLHPGERRPTDTILKSAVLQKSTPFGFVKNGACTQENSSMTYAGQSLAPMDVDDFAFTDVVYGFYTNEWNTEVNFMNTSSDANYSFTYAEARGNSIWPKEFDFSNMLNLFFHGSVMVDRAIANSEQRQHYCTLSDGRNDLDKTPDSSISTDEWTYDDGGYRICQGPVTSLFTLVNAAAEMTSESINDLSDVVIKTLDVSFPSAFELNATKISMEKRNLTEQIQVEALTIDVVLKTSTKYGLPVCEFYHIPCEDSQVKKQPVPGSNDTVDLSPCTFGISSVPVSVGTRLVPFST
ncbi:hypothetical protein P3T76_005533 [Phytophthora citrophthora]|uniref:Uncharacterized protein n=1 Tax=Phytophthora citrophthora TaxID=4793 RepID=A0AAD9GR16_9STRA|nr:hypothetical protein P3T76_005533 [Phytophthora citrophthora]